MVGVGKGDVDEATVGVAVGFDDFGEVVEDEIGADVGTGVGVKVGTGVGVKVGDKSSDLKVAMQPVQEVGKKYVPEFAVSLVVDILINSASVKGVPKFSACPLDKA